MKVKNKIVVITGGGNGLGRQLTLNLLRRGATVVAADIREDYLAETAKLSSNPGKLKTAVLDITDRDAVFKFASETINDMGHVDMLINNAGIIQPFVALNDLSFEAAEHVMNVNFFGTLNMIKAFLPHLLERPESHLVNVSSMGGFFPVPGQTIYGASKAAMKLMTEGLYAELLGTSVKVTIVFPGGMSTEITKNSNVTMAEVSAEENDKYAKMMLSPDKAADIMLNAIEKDVYRLFLGKDSKMMHTLYKLSPVSATKMMKKMMGSRLE